MGKILSIWGENPVSSPRTRPHVRAWHMGVIIAIVEPRSWNCKSAWPLFFLELSKILLNNGLLWGFSNLHPPDCLCCCTQLASYCDVLRTNIRCWVLSLRWWARALQPKGTGNSIAHKPADRMQLPGPILLNSLSTQCWMSFFNYRTSDSKSYDDFLFLQS